MIVGYTGTQGGMTQRQKDGLAWLFRVLPVSFLRHGDCIGGDDEAHDIYLANGPLATEDSIFIHPGFNPKRPEDNSKRAFRNGNVVVSPLPYLRRNRYVAGCVAGFQTDLLIACPGEMKERPSYSGTWATVRYARQVWTPRIILLP